MTRKIGLSLLLAVCALALLLTGCSGKPSIGVQKDVYMGMPQEELRTANGEPDVSYEEEDGTTLLGYDTLSLYGLTFRADYNFDEKGLMKAVFIADVVDPDEAEEIYTTAYEDVAEALGSQSGYYDEGTQGIMGQDERVYVYMGTDVFTACVSYEYGMMTFTFMPKDIPIQ